jgi:hypothetical protein
MKCSLGHGNPDRQRYCGECGEKLPEAESRPPKSAEAARVSATPMHSASQVAACSVCRGALRDNLTRENSECIKCGRQWRVVQCGMCHHLGLMPVAVDRYTCWSCNAVQEATTDPGWRNASPKERNRLAASNTAVPPRRIGSGLFANYRVSPSERARFQARQQANVARKRRVEGVTCPSCHQQQAERISRSKKAGAGAAFGVLAAGYASKTFKCQNCRYTW